MRYKVQLSLLVGFTILLLSLSSVAAGFSGEPVGQPGQTAGEGAAPAKRPLLQTDPVTLTLLHNNDGESGLLPQSRTVNNLAVDIAGVAGFKTVAERELQDATNSGNASLFVYAGDAFLASAILQCSLEITGTVYDAEAQRQIPYTAHILGNHEFDYSPDFLERFIRAFDDGGGLTQPFLSANLDFSGEPGFADLLDADGLIKDPVIDDRVVGKSLVITDTASGEAFGIVGATTPALPTISSPRNVTVTANLTDTAAAVQAEIDRLVNQGVNKIIFVSHLQDVNNDKELITLLSDVDIAVGGGGDELLTNKDISQDLQLLPAQSPDEIEGDYPTVVKDKDNRDVYLVTSIDQYKMIGRLDVKFDAAGEVTEVISAKSYPRRVIINSPNAVTLGYTDAVTKDANLITTVETPITQCLENFETQIVATTDVLLDVSRNTVRAKESNAGNLIADAFLHAHRKYAAESGIGVPDARTIAVQNGGGIRQNAGDQLPTSGTVPGNITYRNTLDVLAFTTNSIQAVRNVPAADVKRIFERSASELPGDGGQFLQVSGITVTYNLAGTAQQIETNGTVTREGSRVRELTLADGTKLVENGEVVAGAPAITITTNNFTASGGDNYPWLAAAPDKVVIGPGGGFLSYDAAWREFLQDSTAQGGLGGNVPNAPPYTAGGVGRIVQAASVYLPVISKN